MRRFLLLLPLLLLIVLFVVSNTASVELRLWPTGWSLQAPLALCVLGAMAIAFLLGALFTWLPALGARRRARRAEARIAALDREVAALKTRLNAQHGDGPTLLPPSG
jgi:uncharacterized integral membrane protein